MLVKTLVSPLDCKEIQPVHPKGGQSWIFIGGSDAEAKTLILRPPDVKNWLTRKDPDAAKDWRQEKKRTTKDEMVGCHHWLIGHEFEQAPGVGDRQGSLECCSLWGLKESDTTEWLNNSNKYEVFRVIKITETRGKVVISGLWQDGKNGNYCLMGVGFWWKFEEEIYKVKIVCRWMMAMVMHF